MELLVLKLNGWPDLFDERVYALSEAVDQLIVIRPRPATEVSSFDSEDILIYDLPPRRGSYIPPKFHTFLFPIYVVQAILLSTGLILINRIRPDVVHALDYLLGGLSGVIISQLFSIPLVLSVRGLGEIRYEQIVANNSGLLVRFNLEIVKALPRLIFPFADHIITKAVYQQDYVRDNYGVDPGFTTIPTGVDFEKFDCDTLDRTTDLSDVLPPDSTLLSDKYSTFLFLGKVIPEKGVDSLVKLVIDQGSNLSEDIRFEIIGDVRSEQFENRLKYQIDQTNGLVRFTPGAIPFEYVPTVLCSVTGVVLFSTPGHEGTPRILQEACAIETPILASDVDGIRGAFTGMNGCKLIDVNDGDAFRRAVEDIHNGIEMERSLFRENFDLYQNYKKYRDIYKNVARY